MEDLREDLEQGAEEELPEADKTEEVSADFEDGDNTAPGDDDDLADFEFDEDGNIVVNGDDDDDDNAEAEAQDDGSDDDDEDGDDTQSVQTEDDDDPDEPEVNTAPKKHTEKTDADFRAAVKDMLIKMGEENVSDDQLLERVMKVAAETADMSLDDYKRHFEAQKIVEDSKKREEKIEQERVMAVDLAALKTSFTELHGVDHLSKIANFTRYCELRAQGNSAEEAYLATNGREVRAKMSKDIQRRSLSGTKNHLSATGGKASGKSNPGISKRELDALRDQFEGDGLSDKEILKLYRRVQKL